MKREKIGRFVVTYKDMGTKEERLQRLQEMMGEEPSDTLKECMEERAKNSWAVQVRGNPGFFLDYAPTLEDAKKKAREIAKQYA